MIILQSNIHSFFHLSLDLGLDEVNRISGLRSIGQMRSRDDQSARANQVSGIAEHLQLARRITRDASEILEVLGVPISWLATFYARFHNLI